MNNIPCALVTGSSRGIGRGIAIELARAGYDLVVNYAGNHAAAQETKQQIEALGRRGFTLQADIADSASGRRLIDETLTHFGRLDLLVNNAGIAPKVRNDLLEMTEASYREVLNTNLTGPFFLTQYAAKKMIELRRQGVMVTGRIVFITSISAYTVSIMRGEYCLSKAALSMACQLFADRLARESILVYEVRPGIIDTDMTSVVKEKYDRLIFEGLTPQPRWGTPEDVGKTVRAIADGCFDFSTGTVFNVDGGFHLRRL